VTRFVKRSWESKIQNAVVWVIQPNQCAGLAQLVEQRFCKPMLIFGKSISWLQSAGKLCYEISMGYTRQCKTNRDIHTVRQKLAGGAVATYRYHRFTRARIYAEPGTPEFDAEMEAIRAASKKRPAETLYVLRALGLGLIKIGIANDLAARMRALRTASPDKLLVLFTIARGGKAMERELHQRFAADRAHGEWFRPSPALMAFIETHSPHNGASDA
jgi:hypothetical protein